jgi:hypothetical protein
VPGDLIEVGVGGKVPADARVWQLLSSTLRIDQVRAVQSLALRRYKAWP